MKKIFALLLGLDLLLVSCAPSATPQPPATGTPMSAPDLFDTPWEERSLFKAGLVSSQQMVLNELPNASVYHIEFRIDDDLYHITGTEEVLYINAEQSALNEIYFRLFPNILGGEMSVTHLTADGQSVASRLELNNSLMVVTLAQPLGPGESIVLRMEFAVTVPQDIERNYGVLAYADNVLALAHAYPMIAVFDDEGWNAEVPPQSGDVTYADASFFLVRITAPSDVTLVTSGHRLSRDEAGDLQTLSVASGPARDFYLVASPEYEEISKTVGEVTIRSYASDGLEKGSEMALDVAARAIEDFSARYAPFPYTEFDIVSTPTLALGIEYPGIVAITSRIYEVDGIFGGAPASVYMESTVAHEVGHQWFYNLVGGDQLDDPWLDESLTQFVTLQYYADEYGPNGEQGFRNSLEGRWESVDRAEIPVGLPVAEYSGQEYSAIVYGRGALFFVALREEMGSEAFDAFIQEYTETLSWEIATPEFLQSLAEKHCACELDELFNEWIYP
ncbi:MAG TPA: M1 family metallopeptidase [Anaerolineales bacterium]|nr:M1 family metallopeptidase [Anaerolineales bacterium]